MEEAKKEYIIALNKLKTLNIKEYETSSFQRNVIEYTDQLNVPQLDGILLEGIEITNTTTTSVDHKLDRKIIGWQIVSINQNSNIYALDADQSFPTKQLVLSSSYVGTVTISLWVF